MEPELDNGSIVELVYLATHGNEAVAVLNLLNVLLSGCLCGYLTQHCLGGRRWGGGGGCKHHTEQGKESKLGRIKGWRRVRWIRKMEMEEWGRF